VFRDAVGVGKTPKALTLSVRQAFGRSEIASRGWKGEWSPERDESAIDI
jgi:hypothetical protein